MTRLQHDATDEQGSCVMLIVLSTFTVTKHLIPHCLTFTPYAAKALHRLHLASLVFATKPSAAQIPPFQILATFDKLDQFPPHIEPLLRLLHHTRYLPSELRAYSFPTPGHTRYNAWNTIYDTRRPREI